MSYRVSPIDLIHSHGSAVVFVSGEYDAERKGMGTAFHLGEGWFATARHVVEDMKITKVGRFDVTQQTHQKENGMMSKTTTWGDWQSEKVEQVFFHPNKEIDLAVFRVPDFLGPEIQLEARADSLSYNEFLLQEVLILGYPRIPGAKQSYMVCVRGEVSAVVEDMWSHKRHFVLSGIPRGGFSGGVALTLNFPPRTLGVVTRALVTHGQDTELGFSAAISAESVFELLDSHGVKIKTVEMTKRGIIVQPRGGARRW